MTRNPEEWFRQQRPRWISPTKLREYYADYLFPNEGENPQYEMYRAVIGGAIRVRHSGRMLTPTEVAALGEKRWSEAEGGEYALPADITLSVEDALRVWAERPGATAMLKGFDP
jgi:hypothetical protein